MPFAIGRRRYSSRIDVLTRNQIARDVASSALPQDIVILIRTCIVGMAYDAESCR